MTDQPKWPEDASVPPENEAGLPGTSDSDIDLNQIQPVEDGASGIFRVDAVILNAEEPSSTASVLSWADNLEQSKQWISQQGDGASLSQDADSDMDLLRILEEERNLNPQDRGPLSGTTGRLHPDELVIQIDPVEAVSAAGDSGVSILNAIEEEYASGESHLHLDQIDHNRHPGASGSAITFDETSNRSDAAQIMPKMAKSQPIDDDEDALMNLPPLPGQDDQPNSSILSGLGLGGSRGMRDDIINDPAAMFVESEAGDSHLESRVRLDSNLPEVHPSDRSQQSSILEILLGQDEPPGSGESLFGAPPSSRSSIPSGFENIDMNLTPVESGSDINIFPGSATREHAKSSSFPDMALPNLPIPSASTPQNPSTRTPTDPSVILPEPEWLAGLNSSEEVTAGPIFGGYTPLAEMLGSTARTADEDDLFNPEEAVDLYGEGGLIGNNITDSGTFAVSDEAIAEANRRIRAVESSAVDLGSTASLGNLDLEMPEELPSFKPDSDPNQYLTSQGDFRLTGPMDSKGSFPEFDDAIDMNAVSSGSEASRISRASEMEFNPEVIAAARQGDQQRIANTPSLQPASMPEMIMTADGNYIPAMSGSRTMPAAGAGLGRSMFLGGALGLALGMLAFVGAYMAGVFKEQGSVAKVEPKTSPAKIEPVVEVAVTPAQARIQLESGDPKAALAAFEKADAKDPLTLAGKGQARWLVYTQAQKANAKPLDRFSAEVKQTQDDLKAAVAAWQANPSKAAEREAARATLWLGLIEESLGNTDAAAKLYTENLAKFPNYASIIQSAVNRLELLSTSKDGQTISQLDIKSWLVMMAISIWQAPVPEEKPAAVEEPVEAGFYFWEAMIHARRHEYPQAKLKLAAAKRAHQAQQAKQLGKGLNPLTDPLEDIFPVCCDQLAIYWSLREKMYKQPSLQPIVTSKDFPSAVDFLVKRGNEMETNIQALARVLNSGNRSPLVVLEEVIASKDKALTDKQAVETQLATLGKSLKAAGFDDGKLEEGLGKLITARVASEKKLEDLVSNLKKAGIDDQDPAKAFTLLAAARDEKEGTLKLIIDKLKASKFIDAQADRENLVKALEKVIAKANTPVTVPGTGSSIGLENAIASVTGIPAAVNQGDVLLKSFEKLKSELLNAKDKAEQNAVLVETERKMSEKLKLETQQRLDEAKSLTEKKLAEAKKEAEKMVADAKATMLKEMTAGSGDLAKKFEIERKDLEVKYTRERKELEQKLSVEKELIAKQLDEEKSQAKKLLTTEKDAFAKKLIESEAGYKKQLSEMTTQYNKDVANLEAESKKKLDELATKSAREAELAKGEFAKQLASAKEELKQAQAMAMKTGPSTVVVSADPKVMIESIDAKIKQLDPKEFAKEVSALLAQRGQTKLESGDVEGALADAKQSAKLAANIESQALEAMVQEKSGKLGEAESAYRALLKEAKPGTPLYRQLRESLARVLLQQRNTTSVPVNEKISARPTSENLIMMLIMLQAPVDAGMDEALKLAEEMIADKDYTGHLIKAEILIQQGKSSLALAEYALGLKRLGKIPSNYEKTLDKIMSGLKSEKQIETIIPEVEVDEYLAQHRFNDGIEAMLCHDFSRAEKRFAAAAKATSDARYYYFLGLSRLIQGQKNAAAADFAVAAKLERQGKPSYRKINESLERVQGDLRKELSQYRP
jgi:hypothetical protein